MPQFKKPQFHFLITAILLISSFMPTTVRSDPNPIKLPSEFNNGDICPIGDLKTRNSCPVKCFRPDPVCGVDGITYWCGCADADCAGTRVVKIGFCEVGNGGSGPVSGQAFLLLHIIWLILLGIFVLFGLL